MVRTGHWSQLERLRGTADPVALFTVVPGLGHRLAERIHEELHLIELERSLPELAHLPEAEAALAALCAELAALDTRTLAALQAEVQHARAAADDVQGGLSQADQNIGDLRRLVHILDQDVIPDLEREGAGAVEATRGFLLPEEAEDMGRRGRKGIRPPSRAPGAGHRAGERRALRGGSRQGRGKSRDQLREAKQAYSLRYDFGYDNDEDAQRYSAERQRYVESELPEYEARVARQRGLAEQELVENFIHRLREQIEDARSQLDHLNATLSKLRFGGERYEFIASPAPDLRQRLRSW